jgi:Ca2+-binding RTX toxin-like protein
MGLAGNDVLRGGTGDDALDGDAGIDRCYQDDGTGSLVECESADLSVSVSGPRRSVGGAIPFSVTVSNAGPDAVPYTLALRLSTQRATCTVAPWVGNNAGALLPAGESRVLDVVADCTRTRKGAKVRVAATVTTPALDPLLDNDAVLAQTNLR